MPVTCGLRYLFLFTRRNTPPSFSTNHTHFFETVSISNPRWTQKDAIKAWKSLCTKWSSSYPTFGRMGQDARYALYFTVLKLPPGVRRMTWTTNWVERLNRDYKRVLRMRGAMPNARSVLALLASAALQRHAYNTPIHQLKQASAFDWI